jgi:hypothetical protein
VIPEYVERLARELDFDPALSQRVRREVEDHLWEAVERNPTNDRLEAERRAVANFGDPRAIASQFAVGSLAKQARRVGVAAVLLIVAVFIAMKARLAWYGVVHCPLLEEMRALSEIVVSIDRYAFWLSVAAGIAGWVYMESRRTPAAFTRLFSRQLRRYSPLFSAAAGALIVSVVGDAVLTSLRLIGAQWSAVFLVPIFSVAIELACAALLVSYLRAMVRRAASAGRAPT